jgi:glycosyltransferase involved in cell wall biosynthesis
MGRDDTVRRADSATPQDAANPAVVKFGEVRADDAEGVLSGSDGATQAFGQPVAAHLDARMFMSSETDVKIAVVVPCFKVSRQVLDVIARIGPECSRIYVVDDCCPERSGDLVSERCRDPRVTVLRHSENEGVGGAVMSGYLAAERDGATVIVKIDGDGQMAPELLPFFVAPILRGTADYTKGNRFFDPEAVRAMPLVRLMGNAALSFMAKLSCGYWDSFDPTNGYTAIHAKLVAHLPWDRISRRYFFESDVLFRLNTLRAVVVDVPMEARYGDEVSSLKVSTVLPEFFAKHLRNTFKRIFYNYFLRDFSTATLSLIVGLLLLGFGLVFGSTQWLAAVRSGTASSAGTVMLAALPTLSGLQLLLAFLNYDIASTPRYPIHPSLGASAGWELSKERRETLGEPRYSKRGFP